MKWIATENGIPLKFQSTESIFGAAILARKRRILVPIKEGEKPHTFISRIRAEGECNRAAVLGTTLRNSMVSELATIQHFVNRGKFEVIPAPRRNKKTKPVHAETELY